VSAQTRFAMAALTAAGLALLAYVVFIQTSVGQTLENMALRGARQELDVVKSESLSELHEISMVTFAVAITVVMGIALLRRKWRLAATVAALMASSVAIAEVAKRILPRPDLIDAPDRWLNNSFPSGHVTVAVAVSIGLVIVVPYALRWLGAVVAAGYAIGIAQAVETAGWHRLSGVIGATLLVVSVACVGLYVLARSGRVTPFRKRRLIGTLVATALLGGLSLFLGAAGLLGVGGLLPLSDGPSQSDFLLAYTATYVIGASVVGLAFLAFLWLIRPYGIDEPVDANETGDAAG
jgi:membrane-associated phospholipid phosphatase